jgi:stearoyl-CoA desaturase (delta-9 desaturase)
MWKNIPSVIYKHRNDLNYPMGIYISLAHIVGMMALPRLSDCQWQTLVFAFLLWPLSGFGITVGVHRLWAHRSYEANILVRTFLMLCNSVANQGSIYHWSRDHRTHHKYSETKADPHNATRGFFFAHMGWLFVKKYRAVVEAGSGLNVDDLKADPVVMFQKKADPWFALFMCFVLPALTAKAMWGETFWNGFFVAGALRYLCVLHFTWCVNSLAHLYGDRPYDENSNPAENWFVSVVAVGEGWHNWHHKYPYDYAASEFGISSQWNPSKLFIDTMAKTGMVWGRKRATKAWAIAQTRAAAKGEGTKKFAGGLEFKNLVETKID